MSRVAKNPITLPSGVAINISGSQLSVKGPKGNLELALYPGISFDEVNGEYLVKNENEKDRKICCGYARCRRKARDAVYLHQDDCRPSSEPHRILGFLRSLG